MTVTRIGSESGVTMRGPKGAEGTPIVSVTEQDEVLTEGSTSTGTEKDRTYIDHTDAEVRHKFQIDIKPPLQNLVVLGREVSDSELAEIDEDEVVTAKPGQHGNVSVLARTPWGSVRTPEYEVGVADPDTSREYTGLVAGSLAKHIVDQVDGLIAGLTASDDTMLVYSTQDHLTPAYVRNSGLWLDVDLTCASPYQDGSQPTKRTGTLIAPDAVLTVDHYPVAVGATIRFVTADGTVIERTVTGRQVVLTPDLSETDLMVAVLDSDVPGTITPVKLLPANIYSYLPTLDGSGPGLPVVNLDCEERASIRAMDHSVNHFREPYESEDEGGYVPWFGLIVAGDSGDPVFLIINGEVVLTTVLTFGWGGWGYPAHEYLTEIDAALSDLGSGHAVETVDLSGFPAY